MLSYLLVLAIFLLAFFGMSIGAMAGRRLKGSCGGISGGACLCEPEKQERCEHKPGADTSISMGDDMVSHIGDRSLR